MPDLRAFLQCRVNLVTSRTPLRKSAVACEASAPSGNGMASSTSRRSVRCSRTLRLLRLLLLLALTLDRELVVFHLHLDVILAHPRQVGADCELSLAFQDVDPRRPLGWDEPGLASEQFVARPRNLGKCHPDSRPKSSKRWSISRANRRRKGNRLPLDISGAVDVVGTTSLVCPGPFWVFGLGASLTSAMAFSFVSEESQVDAHTLDYPCVPPPQG